MKKKSLLVLLSIAVINCSYSQFIAGKKMLGGNLNFNTQSNESSSSSFVRYTNFGLSSSLSRFSTPTTVKGFGLSYSFLYNSAGSALANKYNSHSFGVFGECTKLKPLGHKVFLAFAGTANLGYGFGKSQGGSVNNLIHAKSYLASINGKIGIWYQLHQKFVLTGDFNNLVSIDYNHTLEEQNNGIEKRTTKTNTFGIRTGLNGISLNSFSVGVRYLLK